MTFISMMIGTITLFTVMSGLSGSQQAKTLPSEFVLYYEMQQALPDTPIEKGHPILAYLGKTQAMSLMEFLNAIEKAQTDERVLELVMRIYEGQYSLTQLQEIREAVLEFREVSGKKTRLITDNFGGFSNGMGEYWFATAFEEIWLQPMGLFSVTGMSIEQPYVQNALDNIGVEFEFEKRKDFKTAPETFTRNSISEESAITLRAIIDQFTETFLNDVAQARGLDLEAVSLLIDNAPMNAQDALDAGLVDYVAPSMALHDLVDKVGTDEEEERELVTITSYHADLPRSHKDFDKGDVAVIMASGAILNDDTMTSNYAFVAPSDFVSARRMSRIINGLPDDVKVIVLRVNSPGGTPSGAEEIRQTILEAKKNGKYVIVSMADMAASGGYWIAMDADHVIASDMTLTGSIGVYGGKPNLEGLWEKIGVSWDVIETGENASMWSINTPYSPSEKKRLNYMMDSTYKAFIERVASGRDMPVEMVEGFAQGRVWTGRDAFERGLVDQVGGLEAALNHAADHLGFEKWQDMPISYWPRQDDPFAELAELFELPFPFGRADISFPLNRFLYPEAIVTMPEFFMDF